MIVLRSQSIQQGTANHSVVNDIRQVSRQTRMVILILPVASHSVVDLVCKGYQMKVVTLTASHSVNATEMREWAKVIERVSFSATVHLHNQLLPVDIATRLSIVIMDIDRDTKREVKTMQNIVVN